MAAGRRLRERRHRPAYASQVLPANHSDSSLSDDEWQPTLDAMRGPRGKTTAQEGDQSSTGTGSLSEAGWTDEDLSMSRQRRKRSGGSAQTDDEDDDEPHDSRDGKVDWMNPRALPRNGAHRRKRALELLERGLCVSALRDDVYNQLDIAQTLFNWEILRQQREQDQRAPRSPTPPPLPPLGPGLSLSRASTPGFIATEPTQQSTSSYIPSAQAMAKMSRWPILAQNLPTLRETLTLKDSLMATVSASRHKFRDLSRRHNAVRRKPKARSAYAQDGPFAAWRTAASDTNTDEQHFEDSINDHSAVSEGSDDDVDSLALSDLDEGVDLSVQPERSKAIQGRLKALYDKTLSSLVGKIPKSDMPARNIYEGPSIYRANAEVTRTIDWSTVARVARQTAGVPDHVVDELESRMQKIYGPPLAPIELERSPVKLPAKTRARRVRTKSAAPALESTSVSAKARGKRRAREDSTAAAEGTLSKRARSQPQVRFTPVPGPEPASLPPLIDLEGMPELPPLLPAPRIE
ncbi:hypothetical protein ACM66B_002965 [Microbotryomycetes sp. NB124-2]